MSRDYLDEVEAQLMARLDAGPPPRPPRRRRELLALAPAVIAAAAVVAIVLGVAGGSGHGRRPKPSSALTENATTTVTGPATTASTTAPTSTSTSTSTTETVATTTNTTTTTAPAGPVPAQFTPTSFTAVSDQQWWLLGTAPCSSPPCTSIVRTDDGGASFVGTPAPRTDHVSQVRFADPQNGFAFGPQLWATHDAGASWQQVELGGNVASLETSGGYVYAIVQPSTGPGRLYRAPIGGGQWLALAQAGDAYAGVWASGSEVLLEGSSSPSAGDQLLISTDDGATFTRHAVPPSVACSFEAGSTPVIWAHCATGMDSGVWRSPDAGATFATAVGSAGAQLPELPNSAAFGSASATTAVTGWQQLYRTTDGGATWSPVASLPSQVSEWSYVGFTDATHGVALGLIDAGHRQVVYYTTDGGASYQPVTISGS